MVGFNVACLDQAMRALSQFYCSRLTHFKALNLLLVSWEPANVQTDEHLFVLRAMAKEYDPSPKLHNCAAPSPIPRLVQRPKATETDHAKATQGKHMAGHEMPTQLNSDIWFSFANTKTKLLTSLAGFGPSDVPTKSYAMLSPWQCSLVP